MKQLVVRIITCIVLITYLIGLSNYVAASLLHFVHHCIAHTLYQHHNHSHGDYENHGHSHNSFVDYSLFIDDKNSTNDTKDEAASPNFEIDFFNHLTNCCNSVEIIPDTLLIKHRYERYYEKNQANKPPYPPPKMFLT